jgi:hypothetical protein
MTGKKSLLIFLVFVFLCMGCVSSVVVFTNDFFQQQDLKKITFYTSGQVIFFRSMDSFNYSQKAASNATMNSNSSTNMFNERVALESNTPGFFHHRTETHLYVQFFAGELVLPFNLGDGKLDVSYLVYDGKKFKYEEGEALLICNPLKVRNTK